MYISDKLTFKNKDIYKCFNFDGFDMMCFCETPILEITNAYITDPDCKPSYNTLILGFNNTQLEKTFYEQNMSDEELYAHCKQHGYKVKTLLGNILVKEKMVIYGIEYKN